MEPSNLDDKARWHLLARLIPFVENNYNMCGYINTSFSSIIMEVA
jgi:predicted ATP-dependent Lon-type protease